MIYSSIVIYHVDFTSLRDCTMRRLPKDRMRERYDSCAGTSSLANLMKACSIQLVGHRRAGASSYVGQFKQIYSMIMRMVRFILSSGNLALRVRYTAWGTHLDCKVVL